MFSLIYHGKLCLWKILNLPCFELQAVLQQAPEVSLRGPTFKTLQRWLCPSDFVASCSWMRLNLSSWIKHRIDGCQVISLRQVPLVWLLVVQQLTSTRSCVQATILQLSQRLSVVTLTILWLDLGVFLRLLPAFYGANDSVSWHSLSKSMVS